MAKREFVDSPEAAYEKLLELLAVREYSYPGAIARLMRAGFSEDHATSAVDKAHDYRFIDNERYVGMYVRSRVARGKGVMSIRNELKKEGLSLDDYPSCFEYLPSDSDQIETCLRILNSKSITAKNKRDAAFRRLYQKGYPVDVCQRAVRLWLESQDVS